jgi:hypothetical protein
MIAIVSATIRTEGHLYKAIAGLSETAGGNCDLL